MRPRNMQTQLAARMLRPYELSARCQADCRRRPAPSGSTSMDATVTRDRSRVAPPAGAVAPVAPTAAALEFSMLSQCKEALRPACRLARPRVRADRGATGRQRTLRAFGGALRLVHPLRRCGSTLTVPARRDREPPGSRTPSGSVLDPHAGITRQSGPFRLDRMDPVDRLASDGGNRRRRSSEDTLPCSSRREAHRSRS